MAISSKIEITGELLDNNSGWDENYKKGLYIDGDNLIYILENFIDKNITITIVTN